MLDETLFGLGVAAVTELIVLLYLKIFPATPDRLKPVVVIGSAAVVSAAAGLLHFYPEWEPVARYIALPIFIAATVMGVYSGGKALADK